MLTNELSAYQPAPDEKWSEARYSFDGRHIVFSITPLSGKVPVYGHKRPAVMDPDGKSIWIIPNSSDAKQYPTFSHSGDKIICAKFICSEINGKKKMEGWDIFEVDIHTGSETRLTWFNFFTLLSPPFEFPDGKTIVLSAYGVPGLPHELDSKDNSYMVKKGDKQRPYPFIIPDRRSPLLDDTNNTRIPLVSSDGKRIFFKGNALKPRKLKWQLRTYGDGDQFFEYTSDGKHRRVTYLPISLIWSADLSPDGKYLAVVHALVSDGRECKRIAICSIKDGSYKIINLPEQPSRIINQPTRQEIENKN